MAAGLPAGIQLGQTCPGCVGFFAAWIKTDHIFVQLLGVGKVHLAFFELSGFEQFLGLVAAAGEGQGEEQDTETVAKECHNPHAVSAILLAWLAPVHPGGDRIGDMI